MSTTLKTAFKLTTETRNYLKDIWGFELVEDIDSHTAAQFIDNIECEPTPGEYTCDRELWKAYCQHKGIRETMTFAQFSQIKHRY
jgi:hypothetical protein